MQVAFGTQCGHVDYEWAINEEASWLSSGGFFADHIKGTSYFAGSNLASSAASAAFQTRTIPSSPPEATIVPSAFVAVR